MPDDRARTRRERPAARPSWKRDLVDKLFLRLSNAKSIDGLWVGAFEGKSSALLPRVEEALLLIRTHDPVSYRRVTHELDRVWVNLVLGSVAIYRESIGTCQLDERFVRSASLELIASTIVHEATHARLARCGIGYEEPLRARVEAVCMRRQLAFAAKLPNGGIAHKEAADTLAYLSPELFTSEAFRARDDQGGVETMRYLDVPEWFIRALLRARHGQVVVLRWLRRVRPKRFLI